MEVNDEFIKKLADLSMIDVDDEVMREIKMEICELVDKLSIVMSEEIKTGFKSDRRTDKVDFDRKKENIDIEDINDYTEDGLIVINRMVGEE